MCYTITVKRDRGKETTMTVATFVNSFNTVNADNRKSAIISFKLNGTRYDRSYLASNSREVTGFTVAPYSDGSMVVEISAR